MWGMFNCIPGYEFSPTQEESSSSSTSRCLDDFVALFERCDEDEDREDVRVPAEDNLMAIVVGMDGNKKEWTDVAGSLCECSGQSYVSTEKSQACMCFRMFDFLNCDIVTAA